MAADPPVSMMTLKTAVKHVQRKITEKNASCFSLPGVAMERDGRHNMVASNDISKEQTRVAKALFNRIRREGEIYITLDAVRDFVPEPKCREAFSILGAGCNAGVGKTITRTRTSHATGGGDDDGGDGGDAVLALWNVINGIRDMYDKRDSLRQTLQDTHGLVASLGSVVQGALLVVIAFQGLAMFEVDTTSLWVVFSSSLVAWAFVFGGVTSRAFESAVFIFAVHPFSVGDWVSIDGEVIQVKQLGLTSTTLQTIQGVTQYIPTSALAFKTINNMTRSGELWLPLIVKIDIGITPAEVAGIESKIRELMEGDPKHFGSGMYCSLRQLDSHLKVELHVYYSLAFNGSFFGEKAVAQGKMIACVQDALLAVGVSYAGTDGVIYMENTNTAALTPTSETARARAKYNLNTHAQVRHVTGIKKVS
jgi:small-conductance mechanosensitive channel